MPEVSVIIPTYNRAHLIGRAIQSVLNQTYREFEIIVVDDGSTDNTEEVVKSFNDERLRYTRHEQNKGAAAARNTGIKIAGGDYIAFQDSDDEWLPGKLEKQIKVFENASSKVGVVYTGILRIQGDKRVYSPGPKITQKEGDIHNALLAGSFIGTQLALVKRECFDKVGIFDECLPAYIDWELWIRISKYYYFRCVDEPLVISYYQPESISANLIANARARQLVLEKHFEDFKKDRKVLAKQLYYIGDLLCLSGEMGEGRSYLVNAVKAYPLNIKLFLLILASFFGEATYNRAINSYRKILRRK